MTGELEFLAEDLTPNGARKMLRVTTVADTEVLYVSCTIADRCARVEFFEPSESAQTLAPLRTAVVAAILRRGERDGLLERDIGFRSDWP